MAFSLLLALFLAQPDPKQLVALYEQALETREKQYGTGHLKTARSASDLGLYLSRLGQRERAAALLRRALAIDEKALGARHPRVIEDLENLASVLPAREAVPLLERAAQSSDARVAARNLSRLAAIQESPDLYRQAIAKEETAARLNDLALLLDPKEALPLLRRALTLREKQLGPSHPETAATLNNLANVLLSLGRLSEAEPLQRRALRALENALGEHPRVATASSNLADILKAKGDVAGARKLYERALTIDEKVYGPNHSEVLADVDNLASVLGEREARLLRQRFGRK
jgi:tetratricopeptide (TPR) repeat protein